jgi:xanthine dehydrogenase YagS FAD-binding subunit
VRPFVFERARDLSHAAMLGRETAQGQTTAPTQFLAGGTTLLDLMKLDVLRPQRVIDLRSLEHEHSVIQVTQSGLRLGAFAKMSTVAANTTVAAIYPVITDSLRSAASAQLRNMATLGGNVLQRSRCSYYRDPSWTQCNKRVPGSGCAAIGRFNRNHAILGVDQSCISQYPGDFGVALIALDAQLEIRGPMGIRRMPFASLHRSASGQPHLEHTLRAGEIITAFYISAAAWTRRSQYLKVRDRASYEFAIAAAAVALDLDGDVVRQARIGLGGMAYRPWRAREAEELLAGKTLSEANAQAAAQAALSGAVTHGHNDHKPELGRRTLVRALLQAKAMPVAT